MPMDYRSTPSAVLQRVKLPGVSQTTRDEIATALADHVETRRAFSLAMLRTGRPVFSVQRNGKPSLGAAVTRRRAANRTASATRRAQRRAAA